MVRIRYAFALYSIWSQILFLTYLMISLAVGVRFELTIPFRVYHISSVAL